MSFLKSPVDLVNFGSISIFMYTQDLSYKMIPSNLKHYSIKLHNSDKNKKNSDVIWRNPYVASTEFILKKIIKHYWDNEINFSVIDVGCQYSTLSCLLANYVSQNNHNEKIFSFDCGIAGLLAEKNILLNNFENNIDFQFLAISNKQSKTKVYFDENFSGDNHIVHRINETLSTYDVSTNSLDCLFPNKKNLIIKIDTQGAEPKVFEGMKNILDSSLGPVLFEFTPWAYQLLIEPIEFLKSIPDQYEIYNINEKFQKLERISRSSFNNFIKEISTNDPFWTDLLIIPTCIKNYEKLVESISNVFN